MSKSRTIPLVVQEQRNGVWHHFGEWKVAQSGKPTNDNLFKYREVFIASTKPGGCNAHLGVTTTGNLRVVRQKDGETLALYIATYPSTYPVAEFLRGFWERDRKFRQQLINARNNHEDNNCRFDQDN